jgi:hypothetical protein
MDIQKFRNELRNLDDQTLRQLKGYITGELNLRFDQKIQRSKADLYVGARVKTSGTKSAGKTFIVEKINPKNVVCREEGRLNSKWRITATLLEVIE